MYYPVAMQDKEKLQVMVHENVLNDLRQFCLDKHGNLRKMGVEVEAALVAHMEAK